MPIDTLQDVYLRLPQLYTESSCAAYKAAFKRAEKLTGKKLVQMPADERAWSEIAAGIVWAGAFKASSPEARQRAFDTWRKKIGAAIRKARAAETEPTPEEAGVAAAWDRIAGYVAEVENTFDAEGTRILPNMSSLSIENLRARIGDLHPGDIDNAAAAARLRAIPSDKVETFRGSIRFFDRLVREQNMHAPIAGLLPDTPIGPLPMLRDAPIDWSCFPESFLESRDKAIKRAIGDQSRRDRRASRAARLAATRQNRRKGARQVRNKENARKTYLGALSWLARHAEKDRETVYETPRLQDLLAPDKIEAAAIRYIARAAEEDSTIQDPLQTSSMTTYFSSLLKIARANGFDEELIFDIEDIADDPEFANDRDGEMAATREAFVKLIDRDPAIVRAIVTGPQTLAREAKRAFNRWEELPDRKRTEALHLSMAAAMIAIQLARPLRTRNVNEMVADGEGADLLAPRQADAGAWIDIARQNVKNRKPIEGPVPGWLWQVIASWIEHGRPKWIERHKTTGCHDNGALFPGTRGGSLSRAGFNKAWNRAMARLGLTGLTPHMMRHVAATLYLARHPGDYPVIAALLCDSYRTVERFYARGEGRAAAELFAQVLADLNPTLNLKGAA
ncbi:tyrosine-type recombinase/integrase [Rhodovulum sp. YNF3179]|uniref:tyrosine-type recombinase/integrase n=1 Tax=Rhodovulum sp. YNF3179 TaxID=3425127 RepID=UPI003D351DC4